MTDSSYSMPRELLSARIEIAARARFEDVLIESESEQMTGQDCLRFFNRVARELKDATPAGAKIAICCKNSFLQTQLILAVMYSRRVPVIFSLEQHEHLHEIHTRLSLALILEESGLDWTTRPLPPAIIFDPDSELCSYRPSPKPAVVAPPVAHPDCGLILFTSGTSGQKKAVNLPVRGLLKTYDWLIPYFDLGSKDVATLLLPLSHTFVLNTQFLPTFLAGGKSVLLNNNSNLGHLYENIGNQKGSFVAILADLLRLLKREKDLRSLPVCSHVRHVQMAGGPINKEHLLLAQELFPNAVIHKGYGMTESIRTCMISSEDPHFFTDACGYLLPGHEVRICDEHGNPLPPGQTGEICIRSETCLLAYDDHPAGSELNSEGFFSTGDVGYLHANKYLVCLDRKDRVFKIKGKKVAAQELERIALEESNIEAAKCAAIYDAQKGMRLVMFLETRGRSYSQILKNHGLELENRLRANLDISKIPRDIVLMDRMPRTENQKIKIGDLHSLWEQQDSMTIIPVGSGFIRFHQVNTPVPGSANAEKGDHI